MTKKFELWLFVEFFDEISYPDKPDGYKLFEDFNAMKEYSGYRSARAKRLMHKNYCSTYTKITQW